MMANNTPIANTTRNGNSQPLRNWKKIMLQDSQRFFNRYGYMLYPKGCIEPNKVCLKKPPKKLVALEERKTYMN
jgi:hypothetical protein